MPPKWLLMSPNIAAPMAAVAAVSIRGCSH